MNEQPSSRRPVLAAYFGSALPPDYDWRNSNHPDFDRFFRYLAGFAEVFDVRVLSVYPITCPLPEHITVSHLDFRYSPGTCWHDFTLWIARRLGMSGVDWEQVCTTDSLPALRRAMALIRSADAFFSTGGPERAWLLHGWARLLRKPSVCDSFDDPLQIALGLGVKVTGPLRKSIWALRIALSYVVIWMGIRAATFACGVNEAHRQLIRRRYGKPLHRVVVIHPVVNETSVDRDAELRRLLGIEPGDFVVGYLGNFRTYSNRDALELLQQTVAPQLAPEKRIKLLVMGDVPDALRLPQPNLIYAGFVRDVNSYLRICHLAMSPVWSAGGLIEMKVIQYLMMGVPVICTAERGNSFETPAVQRVPRAAFAAEIARLANDPTAHEAMRREARAYYEGHYAPANAEKELRGLVCRVKYLVSE